MDPPELRMSKTSCAPGSLDGDTPPAMGSLKRGSASLVTIGDQQQESAVKAR